MNRYQSPLPRAALAMAAAALTAMTFGLWVVAPAKTHPASYEPRSLASAKALTPVAADNATGITRIDVVAERQPMRIDVVAVRQPTLSTVAVRQLQPVHSKPKQQS